jgi:hypothetical protein
MRGRAMWTYWVAFSHDAGMSAVAVNVGAPLESADQVVSLAAWIEVDARVRRVTVLSWQLLSAPDQPPAASPVVERPAGAGCDECRDVGPLLTAPGTSGRSWGCGSCGTTWPGQSAPAVPGSVDASVSTPVVGSASGLASGAGRVGVVAVARVLAAADRVGLTTWDVELAFLAYQDFELQVRATFDVPPAAADCDRLFAELGLVGPPSVRSHRVGQPNAFSVRVGVVPVEGVRVEVRVHCQPDPDEAVTGPDTEPVPVPDQAPGQAPGQAPDQGADVAGGSGVTR